MIPHDSPRSRRRSVIRHSSSARTPSPPLRVFQPSKASLHVDTPCSPTTTPTTSLTPKPTLPTPTQSTWTPSRSVPPLARLPHLIARFVPSRLSSSLTLALPPPSLLRFAASERRQLRLRDCPGHWSRGVQGGQQGSRQGLERFPRIASFRRVRRRRRQG